MRSKKTRKLNKTNSGSSSLAQQTYTYPPTVILPMLQSSPVPRTTASTHGTSRSHRRRSARPTHSPARGKKKALGRERNGGPTIPSHFASKPYVYTPPSISSPLRASGSRPSRFHSQSTGSPSIAPLSPLPPPLLPEHQFTVLAQKQLVCPANTAAQ